MILTPEQKRDLENLKDSAWYKVLKLIEKESNDELYERLSTFDIDNEEDKKTIKRFQIYKKAREDFFNNIDSYLREVYTPSNIPWIDD